MNGKESLLREFGDLNRRVAKLEYDFQKAIDDKSANKKEEQSRDLKSKQIDSMYAYMDVLSARILLEMEEK